MTFARNSLVSYTMVFLVAGALLSVPARAQGAYEQAWSSQLGTGSDEECWSVAIDANRRAYISGRTKGDLAGSNQGTFDAYLYRLDASGTPTRGWQLGTSDDDQGRGVALDVSGDAYVGGFTYGTLGAASHGHYDAFLAKYDTSDTSTSDPLWTRQVGTAELDKGVGAAVDSDGNAYLAGFTDGDLVGTNQGSWDGFVAKYDGDGTSQWSRQFGTDAFDEIRSISVAGEAVYITGGTEGDLDGQVGGEDAFVIKYDTDGAEQWTRQFGSDNWDVAQSVAADSNGNAYVTGITSGDLAGTNSGLDDVFLVKYDADGNESWRRQLGTSETERGVSVAVDAEGSAFVVGRTRGVLGDSSEGEADAFLVKYDASGNHLWTRQFGTDEFDESLAASVDGEGNVYTGGYTYGDLGGANAGWKDAFLVKYQVPEPATLGLVVLGGMLLGGKRRRGGLFRNGVGRGS
ncbi:MAG: SBBP repeat-containing protein [Planctomycetota bacterium]